MHIIHPGGSTPVPVGLAPIGLEFAHVSRSIHGLVYCSMWLKGAKKRRLFIETYMTACIKRAVEAH